MITARNTEFTTVEHTVEGVWTGHRGRIADKLTTMNRRLAKLGAPAATVEFGPEVEREDKDPITGYTFRWTEFEWVTITGVAAKYGGWTPVASLDHTFVTPDGNDEALLSKFPAAVDAEIEIPAELRFVGSECDHCRKSRNRNTTVLFRSDDGDWMNVGTSCFRDFVGVTPATVLWLSTAIADFDDEDEFRAPREAYEHDLTEVLRVAAAITSIWGFTRSSELDSTKASMIEVLNGGKIAREITSHFGWADAWAASAAKAEAIKAWVLEEADRGYSDYIANAALAIRANRAAPRTLGLLASLPFAHDRAMGIIAEREAKAAARPTTVDEHLGEIGDKLVLRPVTIVKAIRVETMYGVSVRVTGIDADGHKVTTFGSGDSLFGVEIDDIVEWRGTVKAHNTSDEYGVETEFNRVKLLDLPSDVDFTRVAKKGDKVKVTISDDTNIRYGLLDPRETPDGWVYDDDTRTLYATIEKVGKRDDRFAYTTNAPIGIFAGADIEVLDPSFEFPAWTMADNDVRRELRPWTTDVRRGELDDAEEGPSLRRVMSRRIREWYEARGVEASDDLIAAEIDRFTNLITTTEEEAA